MRWYNTSLDEVIKYLIGVIMAGIQAVLIYIAIYYSWVGHEVVTDFILTIAVAILSLLNVVAFWRFIIDWKKKEGF